MSQDNTFRVMERSKLRLCKYCDSGRITRKGFKNNKYGKVQLFKCKDCKRKFTTNFGFEKMRHKPVIITRALQMYYSGMSVRDIADCFEQEEIRCKLSFSIYEVDRQIFQNDCQIS